MKRVYFIKPIGMDGPVKIGTSESPECRRKVLDSWSPFALEIVAEWDGGESVERQFHHRHRSSHQRREWFTASPLLLADIAAISEGRFDPAVLPAPQLLPRKPKDVSYITPAWKYRRSVMSRLNHCCQVSSALHDVIGPHWPVANFLDHRDSLEEMVSRMLASNPRPARRPA